MTTKKESKKKQSPYYNFRTAELLDLLSTNDKHAFSALTDRQVEVINGLNKIKSMLNSGRITYKAADGSTQEVTGKTVRSGFASITNLIKHNKKVYENSSHRERQEFVPTEAKGQFAPVVISAPLRDFFRDSLAISAPDAWGSLKYLSEQYALLSTVRNAFYFTTKGLQSQEKGRGNVTIPDQALVNLLNSRPLFLYQGGEMNRKGKRQWVKVPYPATDAAVDDPELRGLTTQDVIASAYGELIARNGKDLSFNPQQMYQLYNLVIISLHSMSGKYLTEAQLAAFASDPEGFAREYEVIEALKRARSTEASDKKAAAKQAKRLLTTKREALANRVIRIKSEIKASG